MTATELEAACAKLPWESSLQNAGCVLGVLAGVVAMVAPWWSYPAPLTDRLWAGGFWAILVLLVFLGLANLRSWPYRREIRRRYGEGSFADCMFACAKTLEADETLEWILVLVGSALPHGGRVEVTLRIDTAGGGHVTVRTKPYDSDSESEWAAAETDVPAARIEPITSLLRQEPLPPFRRIDPSVMDGFPFHLGILRRQPPLALQAGGNLAGVPERLQSEPTFVVAGQLLALTSDVGAPPMAIGWCDPSGDIGMGTV